MRTLGAQHKASGVKPYDYLRVGEALLATIGNALGGAFDDRTRAAWVVLYREANTAMIAGANGGDSADKDGRRVRRAGERVACAPLPA